MGGQWWRRTFGIIGLLIGVGIIASFAYGAGPMSSGVWTTMHAGGAPDTMMRGDGFWHGGFFLFRILFGLFFLLLLLSLARFTIFGGGHWGDGAMGRDGHGGRHDMHDDAHRTAFEDWHRAAHNGHSAPPPASDGDERGQ